MKQQNHLIDLNDYPDHACTAYHENPASLQRRVYGENHGDIVLRAEYAHTNELSVRDVTAWRRYNRL
jgi:hypothetical protein